MKFFSKCRQQDLNWGAHPVKPCTSTLRPIAQPTRSTPWVPQNIHCKWLQVFNLIKSFNYSICHHLLQKFKYCDNVLSNLSCLLLKDDDIYYHFQQNIFVSRYILSLVNRFYEIKKYFISNNIMSFASKSNKRETCAKITIH